ncbi:MAG: ribosomal protein S18-alanine N-acetyltransferase, partial [Candidatus Spyradocola sp.]
GTWFVIDEGHITNIAVAPECRGKGYGTRVMAAMMQNAVDLGVTYMTLEVRVGNVPALALYKKMGFKKAGVRKKYYEDNGEDAYIMVNDRLQLSIDRAAQAMKEEDA